LTFHSSQAAKASARKASHHLTQPHKGVTNIIFLAINDCITDEAKATASGA